MNDGKQLAKARKKSAKNFTLTYSLQLKEAESANPPISMSKQPHALSKTDNSKASGQAQISTKALKASGRCLWKALAERFNKQFLVGKIPDARRKSKTTVLQKKGVEEDLKNYKPICVLPQLYELFTKIITNRLTAALEETQPCQQADF